MELEFASGVRGIVRGPADLTLQREDLLDLANGTAWFEVPADAVGFKVNTPDLILTDLGTEFGIISESNFLDEVHVFDGKVEVRNRYGLATYRTPPSWPGPLCRTGRSLAGNPGPSRPLSR